MLSHLIYDAVTSLKQLRADVRTELGELNDCGQEITFPTISDLVEFLGIGLH